MWATHKNTTPASGSKLIFAFVMIVSKAQTAKNLNMTITGWLLKY